MIRVLFNKKGGVGKSSLTSNLAAISAARGFKTLVIDLDTQCNTSHYLLGSQQAATDGLNMADFYEQTITFNLRKKPTSEFCRPCQYDNLFIIPSSPELDNIQVKLESRHKIYKLREGLAELQGQFDRIYIDTAPALNFYSLSALIAADRCLIPMDCDEFSRHAVSSIMAHLLEIKEDHHPELVIEGIIANQFVARAKAPQHMIDLLQQAGLTVLNSKISSSVKMRESHQTHTPLIHLAPQHKLSQELLALWDEIETARPI